MSVESPCVLPAPVAIIPSLARIVGESINRRAGQAALRKNGGNLGGCSQPPLVGRARGTREIKAGRVVRAAVGIANHRRTEN